MQRSSKLTRISGLPLDTPPMEAKATDELPVEDGEWQFEPKWDGFRCLAFRQGDTVELRAKSGKPRRSRRHAPSSTQSPPHAIKAVASIAPNFEPEPTIFGVVSSAKGLNDTKDKFMKRSIAIATLLLTSAFAVPVLAEDTTTTTTGTQVQTDPSTTASTDGKVNFETVMSSIKGGKTNVSAIGGMTSVNRVNIIRVGDLARGNNMQALDKAISDNQADITGLQTAISANTALKAKLDAESVQASSVIAGNVEADGSVTVYVK